MSMAPFGSQENRNPTEDPGDGSSQPPTPNRTPYRTPTAIRAQVPVKLEESPASLSSAFEATIQNPAVRQSDGANRSGPDPLWVTKVAPATPTAAATAPPTAPIVDFVKLPPVLWTVILSNLDARGLVRLKQTSRHLRAAIPRAGTAFRLILPPSASPPSLRCLLRGYRDLAIVDIQGCRDVQLRDWPWLSGTACGRSMGGLRELRLADVNLRMCAVASLQPLFRRLQRLALRGVLLLGAKQLGVVLASPELEEITLDGLRLHGDSDVLAEALGALAGLRVLHLPNAASVAAFRLKSPSLEILDLRGCATLHRLHVDMRALEYLDLSYTAVTGEAVEAAVGRCPSLRSLLLQGCLQLEAVCILSASLTLLDISTCSALRHLRVVGDEVHLLHVDLCVALERLILDVPSVRRLDLSMLPMNHLQLRAARLKKLNLNGCSLLRDIEAQTPRLQALFVASTPAPVGAFGLGDRETGAVFGGRR